jgi:hypothetical protein
MRAIKCICTFVKPIERDLVRVPALREKRSLRGRLARAAVAGDAGGWPAIRQPPNRRTRWRAPHAPRWLQGGARRTERPAPTSMGARTEIRAISSSVFHTICLSVRGRGVRRVKFSVRIRIRLVPLRI